MFTPAKTLRDVASNAIRQIEALGPDQRGVSSIEFALFAGLLSVGLLNTVDLSLYIYKRLELENATQMGAQAAWKKCDGPTKLPATINCSGLTATITSAVQSTSLGNKVTLQSGSPAEGYYCVNSSGLLQYVGAVTSSKPSDCSAAGMAALTPSDYIRVTTVFSYAPLFPGMTVASTFTTPIVKTSMMRLD